MSGSAFIPLLKNAASGVALTRDQAVRAFQIIMNGGATPAQMAGLLTALAMRGESAAEIAGAAEALLAKCSRFQAPEGAMDTCGTGGDAGSSGTLNISTAAALTVAACGVPVVKHGNRAVSSRSGSADVLEALGVRIDAEAAAMERCLRETNFCFLFAPRYHTAMRHVAPVRQELGFRTIFNLIGPLVNPARPKRQLLGVFSERWLVPMAEVLRELGVTHAWVVHGTSGGMDELSLSGGSEVAELSGGEIRRFTVSPEQAGLACAPQESLKGGDAAFNAESLRKLLLGEPGAYRDAVALNAGAALVVAQKAETLREGVEMALSALSEGRAHSVLQHVLIHSRAGAAS